MTRQIILSAGRLISSKRVWLLLKHLLVVVVFLPLFFVANEAQAREFVLKCGKPQSYVAAGKRGSLSPHVFGTHVLFHKEKDTRRRKPRFLSTMRATGIRAARFPGGTLADNYHWRTKTLERRRWWPNGHKTTPNDLDFDEFMHFMKCIGGEPTLVLNLRSWIANGNIKGAITEAENWVRYANIQKKYGVRYLEFGNELYLKNNQKSSPITGRDYGRIYLMLKKRIKRIDPRVKIGVVMPKRINLVPYRHQERWWDAVLSEAGREIDYLIIHRYVPLKVGKFGNRGSGYDRALGRMRAYMRQEFGLNLPIHITEWNLRKKNQRGRKMRYNSIGQAAFIVDSLIDFTKQNVRYANFWPTLVDKNLKLNAAGRAFQLMYSIVGGKLRDDGMMARHIRVSEFSFSSSRSAFVLVNRGNRGFRINLQSLMRTCGRIVQVRKVVAARSEVRLDQRPAKTVHFKMSDRKALHLQPFSTAIIDTKVPGRKLQFCK